MSTKTEVARKTIVAEKNISKDVSLPGVKLDPHKQKLSNSNKDKVESGIFEIDAKAENSAEYYGTYSKPGLAKLLAAIRVDINYHKAEGCYLFYEKNNLEIPVLDVMAGYGACLFGHNYQPFVDVYKDCLAQKRPFLVQASKRGQVGLLGKKLDEILHASTGKHFVSITLNTGAESAEAAFKYSDFRRKSQAKKQWHYFERAFCDAQAALQDGQAKMDEASLNKIATKYQLNPGLPQSEVLRDWRSSIQNIIFSASSVGLGLKNSYHGKTTGALQLTHGESFRLPFAGLGPTTEFIDQEDISSLQEAVAHNSIQILFPCVVDGSIICKEIPFCLISALFIEPIQGEGGVRPIDKEFLAACRACADQNDFLLVFDEIQCGMGRTGTMLYSEQQQVVADIYLLSKSLGGGLSKISVACVDREKYEPVFDQIHSSTFAEDDFSAAVAISALDEIQNNTELTENIKQQGRYLLEGLSSLKQRFPDVIQDVRGTGLLIGLEIKNQIGRDSYVFKVLSEAKLLGHVIAGYMLREHQIRIAATMSDNFVIRIQPPALITQQECDYLLSALENVANIIDRANAYELCKYLVELESESTPTLTERKFPDLDLIEDYRGRNNGLPNKIDPNVKSVTFVGTPSSAFVMAEGETSFKKFSQAQLIQFFGQVCEVLGPVELQTNTIISNTGEKINFRLVGIMYEPHYVVRHLRSQNVEHMVADVDTELQSAIDRRAQAFGLGTYTSIFTNNGKSLATDQISITTGNALTVGMGFRGLLTLAEEKDIELKSATLGVLGAGGNIGTVYSELLADHVPALVLFGRKDRLEKLYDVTYKIYANAASDIQSGRFLETSVAAKLKDTETWKHALEKIEQQGLENIGEFIHNQLIEEFGEDVPVKVTSDTNLVSTVNLLLTASNAPKPIIYSDMMGSHPTVICDVAVPQDVDDSVAQECPNVNLIRGGLCRMPNNPEVAMLGSYTIGNGVAYACMVETMLMGFESYKGHGSYGPISKSQVHKFLSLADVHGFKLESMKVTNPFDLKPN